MAISIIDPISSIPTYLTDDSVTVTTVTSTLRAGWENAGLYPGERILVTLERAATATDEIIGASDDLPVTFRNTTDVYHYVRTYRQDPSNGMYRIQVGENDFGADFNRALGRYVQLTDN